MAFLQAGASLPDIRNSNRAIAISAPLPSPKAASRSGKAPGPGLPCTGIAISKKQGISLSTCQVPFTSLARLGSVADAHTEGHGSAGRGDIQTHSNYCLTTRMRSRYM